MTNRERILAVLRGDIPDRLPWAPRWDLFFEAASRTGRLPQRYRGYTYFDVCRDLGAGIKATRGSAYRARVRGVETKVSVEGHDTVTLYQTPFGEVSQRFRVTPELQAQGVRGILVEFLVKSCEDFDAVRYVVDHTEVEPTYEPLLHLQREVGDDGVVIVDGGMCPLHYVMRHLAGYETTYFQLYDCPCQLEGLLQSIEAYQHRIQEAVLSSPAEIVRCDGHFDWQVTPKPLYQQYFLPFFVQYKERLQASGKYMLAHTDADPRGLLELIGKSGFDIAEAFTPQPMTGVTIAQARAVWQNHVVIWGGIASIMLSLDVPDDQFEEHVVDAIRQGGAGDRFILGLGDNAPTDTSFERIARIGELVDMHGHYPLTGNTRKEMER